MGIPALTNEQTNTAVENLRLVVDVLNNDLALTLEHAHWRMLLDLILLQFMRCWTCRLIKCARQLMLLQKGLRRAGGGGNPRMVYPFSVLETAKQNLPQYPLAGKAGTT